MLRTLSEASISTCRPSIPYNDPATDDAVSNDASDSWRRIAAGNWTSSNNPVNRWESCRIAIQYCNIFLANIERVTWAADEEVNKLFHDRFLGEAHALRGMLMYYLLQAHSGVDNAGALLGIPIVEVAEDASSEFNVPRNTFAECIDAMKKDFEIAMKYLPTEYGEEYYSEVAQKYPGVSQGSIMRVFGAGFMVRVSGRIIEAYLSKATLMAASPAFSASGVTWEEAANAAAKVISYNGNLRELVRQVATGIAIPRWMISSTVHVRMKCSGVPRRVTATTWRPPTSLRHSTAAAE